MRHRTVKVTFGRNSGPRQALLRGLVSALVENGRIKTTLAKAKELRRHVERAVTMSKKGDLHARRILLSRYPNEATVTTLIDDLGKRFAKRMGGYTRVVKIGPRPGDCADMAYIEFVDYKAPTAKGEETVKGDKGLVKKAKAKAKADEKSRKARRQMQVANRRYNRDLA